MDEDDEEEEEEEETESVDEANNDVEKSESSDDDDEDDDGDESDTNMEIDDDVRETVKTALGDAAVHSDAEVGIIQNMSFTATSVGICFRNYFDEKCIE